MGNHVYIGWEPREVVAWKVARSSLLRHASSAKGLWIHPLELHKLGHILTRPVERRDGKLWCPISQAPMATEFAISRFCVPLMHLEGWALFCDCDVLFLGDIVDLFALADPKYAVMVVKHKQESGAAVKMDNQAQLFYSRKNWSSIMLINCGHASNRKLTPEALNTWPGRDLHAFKWLEDSEIGELPVEWNFLVGVTPETNTPKKLLHYTLGTPNMPGYENCAYSKEWNEQRSLM